MQPLTPLFQMKTQRLNLSAENDFQANIPDVLKDVETCDTVPKFPYPLKTTVSIGELGP